LGKHAEPIKQQLSDILRRVDPQLILTFGPKDGITNHPDHKLMGRLTSEVAMEADKAANVYHMGLTPDDFEKFKSTFGDPLSDSWKNLQTVDPDDVQVRVDIQRALERKVSSLACHGSQFDK